MQAAKQILRSFIIVAMAALVILPADLIPDVIPMLGWIDDAIYILAGVKETISIIDGMKQKRIETS